MRTQESLHFVHSLKTFCQLKEMKEVVVVCDPDYSDVFEGCKIVHTYSIFIDLAMHLSKVVKNHYPLLQVLLRTCKYLLNLHAQEKRDRTLFLMDFRSVTTHLYIAFSAHVDKYRRDLVFRLFAGN